MFAEKALGRGQVAGGDYEIVIDKDDNLALRDGNGAILKATLAGRRIMKMAGYGDIRGERRRVWSAIVSNQNFMLAGHDLPSEAVKQLGERLRSIVAGDYDGYFQLRPLGAV